MLHQYSDGSILRLMSTSELVAIPIWKGQRILDQEHAAAIKAAVGSKINSLDSGYSIVKYNEETADGKMVLSSYLIDGQHRASVVRDFYSSTFCEPHFHVTVREKTVESESEAIHYFNTINNVKAQQWKMDTNLLINNYIIALEKAFNVHKKCPLIRAGTTVRPYLSSTELRVAFQAQKELLKTSADDVAEFILRVEKYNTSKVSEFEIETAYDAVKDKKLKERAVLASFALAYDTKLRWVRYCLLDT